MPREHRKVTPARARVEWACCTGHKVVRCVQPCYYWERGWIVNRVHSPLPSPDQAGAKTAPPPPLPCTDRHAGGPKRAVKVWRRLGP